MFCGNAGTLWDCHGKAEVPGAHRDSTDTPFYHKMKEHVFILFFQVRVSSVFPKIG